MVLPAARAATQAFSLTITSPAQNATFPTGAPLTITAAVAGNANPIAKIDFYNMATSAKLGTATAAPYAITWTPTAAGTVFLRVTGTDSTGTTANSTITTVKVVASGSTTPPPTTTTYTVTVNNGTANGVASGTFAPGTFITLVAATPPTGQAFKWWTGQAPLANSQSASTTFTMPANNVTLSAVFYTPPPLPAIAAGHPRLWLTPADVQRLRTWTTPNNTVYQGLLQMLARAKHGYQLCFPNGQTPAVPYPDAGDINGWAGATITVNNDLVSEQHALVLAFFALIDPDPAARLAHAQKARAMFMYIMNEAAKGHAAGQPFRDPIFSIFCRSNGTGEAWPLITDWLQGVTDGNGQPVAIFTSQDKLTIRNVFMLWAVDCLNAYTCGGDHPAPFGVTNSTALLPNGNAHRVAVNNYYLNHARLITMMPLTLDAADDPLIDPAAPAAQLGNTLRSYILNATGAWLYQQFAMFGDPAAVRASYNLPATASVGLASGGVPPEGSLYGHSINYIQGQLLALQTAGLTDSAVVGPQIALLNAPVWDRFVKAASATLVPQPKVFASDSYLGSVYQFAGFGDMLRTWVTPDMVEAMALLALTERAQGRTKHLNEARWYAMNVLEGGAPDFMRRIINPYSTTESLLYFMLFDPTDPTALHPTDPRPGYPTAHFDAGMGRLLARTDWTPQASFFSFRSGWLSINHQNCDGGQFELYRKGEWLTKELSNYDNYGNGQSTIWHNTLALQNWCSVTPAVQWFEQPYLKYGSQWNNGQSAGDPVTIASSGAGYAYADTDLTNLYNHPWTFNPALNLTDITHASRSVLWLNGDYAVVYDRAGSQHSGLFKRFNLNFTTTPVVDNAARTAVATTPLGRKFAVQSLLPTAATLTYVPEAGSLTNIAILEPMTGRLVVEDPASPTDVRFLHVLQGADTVATIASAAVVQSTAGTSYEGAVVGGALALFPKNHGALFVGTTYSAAVNVKQHFVTGLTPAANYSVTTTSDGITTTVTISAGGAFVADSAGLLNFVLP